MLQPRRPLPESLGGRFTVADALAAGVTPSRLRSGDLTQSFHGTRSRTEPPPAQALVLDRLGRPRGELERAHLERAFEYATRMGPHEFFSHVTAAVIWGLPLPATLLRGSDLHVGVFAPSRLPRSAGVRGHQIVQLKTKITSEPWTGLKVTDAAATWVMLASVLRHPYDLVAVADAVVRDWRAHPLGTVDDLRAAMTTGRRVGIQKLREALPLARTRSASRPETRVRLELRDAGLPEPKLNYEVIEQALYLGSVDLAYPELRIAIEYEGEHHLLDPEQWARDIARYERLVSAGWIVIRVTKAELFGDPAALARRVRAAIAQRVG